MGFRTGQHLIHAKRAAESRLVGPTATVHKFGEKFLDLHDGPAERAQSKHKKRGENRGETAVFACSRFGGGGFVSHAPQLYLTQMRAFSWISPKRQ
jgi:hypothetical protein